MRTQKTYGHQKRVVVDCTGLDDHPMIADPGAFLEDNGILFWFNRIIMNPIGLHIRLHKAEATNIVCLSIIDYRFDEFGILVDQDTFDDGVKKYTKYIRSTHLAIINRLLRTGTILQSSDTLAKLELKNKP